MNEANEENVNCLRIGGCLYGDDFSAAERWAADHPDSWRVHRLRTINHFDIVEYPWWLAF